MDQFGDALLMFDRNPDIGAIVLTGSARAFAAGADIAAMSDYDFVDAYGNDFITRNIRWGSLHLGHGYFYLQRMLLDDRTLALW